MFLGVLPSVLVVGFMDPAAFNGDYKKSSFKFNHSNLDSIEIQVDNLPIINHPIKMNGTSGNDFFWNYLKNTNRFYNMFSTGSLSYTNFMTSNFLVFTNLKQDGHTHGQLTVKLKFKEVLSEKLFCLLVPIHEKKIVFDAYMNAQVQH